jgi:hypothetical protein
MSEVQREYEYVSARARVWGMAGGDNQKHMRVDSPGLVIVPRHELHEVLRQGDAGLLVEDGRVLIPDHVR